jgi:hypothetical protein
MLLTACLATQVDVTVCGLRTRRVKLFFITDHDSVITPSQTSLHLSCHSLNNGVKDELLAQEMDNIKLSLDASIANLSDVARCTFLKAPASTDVYLQLLPKPLFECKFELIHLQLVLGVTLAESTLQKTVFEKNTNLEEVRQNERDNQLQGAQERTDVSDEVEEGVRRPVDFGMSNAQIKLHLQKLFCFEELCRRLWDTDLFIVQKFVDICTRVRVDHMVIPVHGIPPEIHFLIITSI